MPQSRNLDHHERERAEQQRFCPVCGEAKTLRGLYGHLMMKHGKEGRELAELASGASVNYENECVEVFHLIFQYFDIWHRYELLDEMSARNCFSHAESYEILRQDLDRQADKVLALLAENGIEFTEDEHISALAEMSAKL